MLAICNSDTYSIYIGESRLASGDQSFIVASPKVIGDVRKQRSGFGTLHPESVVEENGYVYWYDKLSRAYVRYASNGIFPISEYKVVSYFEDVSEINGVDDAVISGYDPYYKMVFVTFPNNPVQGKTIGFSLTKDRWISFYGFKPIGYFCDGTKMLSITGGNIWSHTAEGSGYNIFYVITNSTEIVLSFNDAPDQPKEWRVVQVQMSPTPFSYVNGDQVLLSDVLRVEMTNRNGQFTSVRYYEFEVDENMAYADIRCDEFSSGGLIEGVLMYSNTLQVKVKISGSSYKTFTMAKIGFDPSLSHSL